jgi:hypothetical protein
MYLQHRTPHCTGSWERESHHTWRCPGCDGIAFNSLATANEIAQDNLPTQRLRQLTREGNVLLDPGNTG